MISDRDELIKIGLSKIPADCRVARSVNIAIKAYNDGLTWEQARELVVEDSKDLGWFQAPANVAFFIIGWLYGEGDFGKSLCTAVNCGDDTDCTGATLGSILGIINGYDAIPKEWIDPIGERIVTIAIDRGSYAPPQNVAQLTDMVMQQIPITLGTFNAPITISDNPTDLSDIATLNLMDDTVAKEIWSKSPFAVEFDLIHTKVIVDYCQEPEVRQGEPFNMKVTLVNQMPDVRHLQLNWVLPEGWLITPNDIQNVTVGHCPSKTEVRVEITPEYITEATSRGILEVVAPGRPTVGLIPLVFLAGV